MLSLAFLIALLFFTVGNAQAQGLGPPDTIASCLGQGDCARCTLFTPSSATSKIVIRPAQTSCLQKLSERSSFLVSVDQQIHAYGRSEALSSNDVDLWMEIDLGSRRGVGVPLGSSGVVLSSQMHQNYEAARASDMAARVRSIEAAINRSSASLNESFSVTLAQLPMTDAAVQAHFEQSNKVFNDTTNAAAVSVMKLAAMPREPLPIRASDSEPFLTHGLSKDAIGERVSAEISEEHRRPSGRDLAGVMHRSEGSVAAHARSEAAKVRAALSNGDIAPQRAIRMHSQLDVAARLSESPYPKGRALGDRIVADVQSERQVSEGKSDTREVSSVDADGNVTVENQPATAAAPENSTGDVIAWISMRADLAEDRSTQAIASANTYEAWDAAQRRSAALASKTMAANAERSLLQGNLGDAEAWAEAALLVADVVTGWVPTLSLGRSSYELVSGRDMFTGAELSDLELAGRVIDIVTVGFGSKITKGWDAVNRIAQKNDKYQRIFASAKKYADRITKLGRNPLIDPDDLAHIADKHMPGGLNHIDEVVEGVAHKATVFNKEVDPLDLAGEAMELISKKSPSIQNVPARSKGASDFFLWDRTGLKPEHIGYSASAADGAINARDVGVMIDRQEGRLVNIYPWNPNNPKPVLKGWD